MYDEAWEYPEDALVDDSYRPETPPQMIPRSKQPTSQPQKPQPEAKPVPVREREPAQEPVQESKPLDPEEPAVLAREQEAVREVPRNAGRVIERPRSIIEMLFPSRDKNPAVRSLSRLKRLSLRQHQPLRLLASLPHKVPRLQA